jgi:pimeloyl-ACP methyl ester carboxylesterase
LDRHADIILVEMGIRGAILAGLAAAFCRGQAGGGPTASADASWRDPSPHSVQFVMVDEKVRLEVLDWGGGTLVNAPGRSVVLLAGLGNTAHVFDNFAPKLTAAGYHVYGITRRGYGAPPGNGASGAPEFGYSADRLGDDVLAVIGALKLDRAVLVGQGLAGEELSSVGSRHPEKIAGLIYLDAAYSYAFYDHTRGELFFDLIDLERKLAQLYLLLPAGPSPLKKDLADVRKELTQLEASNGLPDDPRFAPPARKLLESNLLARFEKDIQEEEQKASRPAEGVKPEPAKRTQDRKRIFDDLLQTSLPGFEKDLREKRTAPTRAAPVQAQPWTLPEAELRLQHETKERAGETERARQAILQGRQKYTHLRLPILAIYCLPRADNDPNEADDEAQAKAFENGVPSARVVRLAHANRMVFLSNEADVLREMKAFLGSLE